ncbi:AraC family transcriptional regulator [Serratia rubidaea]|uniref:AraC family transcriptional regulator n=1 Tax=Serratia rubidaea TaxID=61652 RepID=A0A3S5AV46_SERRU|nr:AraC family transcriptional regulator [Serratia rubidaea]MBH1932180.1 AraC family transcriptional regulator [Serratia rubidaea]MDC6117969.1 AraC family transcriptional regulator [Serratia rubidaea]MEB7585651.1 AraC family transcriptional regulator [Serratia rubidaea]VEI66952.1 L-rhamnose operon regulatory protein rhaS [Serratia rubidaea]
MEQQLNELRTLAAHAQSHRTETGIPRVAMIQGAIPEHQLTAVYDPMVNLILQGSKSMTVGGQTLHYDPATYFVMSVGLPATGVIHCSRSGAPYLAVSLTLDTGLLVDMLSKLPNTAGEEKKENGFSVAAVTAELLDAWLRMLRLIKQPDDIPALAPAYEREILYRVLQGPMGWMLRDIATPDTVLARVNRAIQRIRREYARPLRVEELAADAAMSTSTFHRHFKAATALSPLQYQKQTRLLQARTLLITAGRSVTSAAHEVGYESPTQFSREYTRVFGLPPAKDAARIIADIKNR